MDILDRIKYLMAERGWTEYRLAKESGLSHSTIANMFHRNNAPTLPTIEAICDAFGISLSQFFIYDNETEISSEQSYILEKWSMLDPAQKEAILNLLKVM